MRAQPQSPIHAEKIEADARSEERIQYFEWLRALAAIAVVLLHVFATLMDNVSVAELSVPISLVWSILQIILTRWAVPIFFMISGALLLDPNRLMNGDKLLKYVLRMLAILATFGLAYCLAESYFKTRAISLSLFSEAILNLVSGHSWSHMWYIYALLGLYLWTPVFRCFTQTASKVLLRGFLVVLFIFALCIPTINDLFGTHIISLTWVSSAVFYFLLGYYAHTYLKVNKPLLILGSVAILVCVMGTSEAIIRFGSLISPLRNPSSPLIALYSLMLFLLAKQYLVSSIRQCTFATSIANYSFGIYLVHPIFLNIIYKIMNWFPYGQFPPVLFEILVFSIAFIGSMALVFVLKRLPLFRKLV